MQAWLRVAMGAGGVDRRLCRRLQHRSSLFGTLALCVGVMPSARVGADAPHDLPTVFIIEQLTPPRRQLESIKLPLDARQSPLSVETVERRFIDNSGYQDLASLLNFGTSALASAADGGRFGDVTVRGFGNTPLFRNGLNDALIGSLPRSTFNIERIEILKGPDAALFGPGDAGGAINIVTKQPQTERAFTAAGEFGYFSATTFNVDATGAVPHHSSFSYRLIAAREQGDTYRDFVKNDHWFVAPALAWQPNATFDIVTSIDLARDLRLHDSGVVAGPDLASLPRSRFLGEPAVGATELFALTSQTTATLALSQAWVVEFQLQGQRTSVVGEGVEPSELDAGTLVRELTASDDSGHAWVAQVELAGPALLWNQRHDLVLGLEATTLEADESLLVSDTDADPFAIDPLAPVYGHALPALLPELLSHESRKQFSAYIQDLWQLDSRWRVLAALRFDHFRQRGFERQSAQRFDSTHSRPSPRLSIVRTSDFGLIWYASYSQSIDPNEGLQPDGQALAPTLGKSLESGLRYTSPAGHYTLDGALFGIRQSDVTVTAPGASGFEIQTARQTSSGLDIELNVRPAAGLEVALRYHFLDTAITDDPSIPDGTAALNAPRHQGAITAVYQFPQGHLTDLVVGLATRYVGRRQASLALSEIDLRLDDYLRIDVFTRWRHTRNLTTQLRLENITGANYIQGSDSDALHLQPGAPFALYGEMQLSY
jgi:iron complex outermembrane recepter protein